MNERIRELGREATIWCADQPNQDDFNALWEEKFALLIIKECATICEHIAEIAEITNTGEVARQTKATAISCSKFIKNRFGVKS
jgi:hypothetical protein